MRVGTHGGEFLGLGPLDLVDRLETLTQEPGENTDNEPDQDHEDPAVPPQPAEGIRENQTMEIFNSLGGGTSVVCVCVCVCVCLCV